MSFPSIRTERRRRRSETAHLLESIRCSDVNTVYENAKVEDTGNNITTINDIELVSLSSPATLNLNTGITFETSELVQITEENDEIKLPENSVNLTDRLRLWSTTHNITQMCLGQLIQILNPHVNFILPTDPRTLMKTPRFVNIDKVSGGEFAYFGIKTGIVRRLKHTLSECNFPLVQKMQSQSKLPILSISVGIDGLPISNSNTKSFWPIIGILDQVKESTPFIIELFYGNSKPTDSLFLEKFVNDASELEMSGIVYEEQNYNFKISCIIADAPARSFLKGCKQHNSYNSCERCVQEGEWLGRVIFRKTDCVKRTDNSFREKTDSDHHTHDSVLLKLRIDLVSQVVLDHMHLVFLGIMKKLLCVWVKGKLPHRLSSKQVLTLSQKLLKLRPFIPRDFQRKPRALSELAHYKATEYRLFLLYTGIVVLGESLQENKFKNFLKLHASMFILLSNYACDRSWNGVARSLLIQFVEELEVLYGPEFMIYNIHSLVHIVDDAMNYGNLSQISAFPFESYMQKIKRMLKGKTYQLNQVAKRVAEAEAILVDTLAKQCTGLVMFSNYKYDNCFRLKNGKFVIQKNFDGFQCSDFYEVQPICRFIEYPFNSLLVGIFIAKITDNTFKVNSDDISMKCILLPYKKNYLCLPLLHTIK